MESKNENHYATFEKPNTAYTVLFGELEMASSSKVLKLLEFHGNFNVGPVYYFPNESIAMSYFQKSETKTRCPLKGEASYYNLVLADKVVEDALWTYEHPLQGVSQINGYSAFYMKKGFERREG